jgi:hypothetical protein
MKAAATQALRDRQAELYGVVVKFVRTLGGSSKKPPPSRQTTPDQSDDDLDGPPNFCWDADDFWKERGFVDAFFGEFTTTAYLALY